MKRFFSVMSLAFVMLACNTRQQQPVTQAAPMPDTTGLAGYQQWKAQHELSSPNQYNSNAANTAAPQKEVVIYRTQPEHVYHRAYSSPVYSSTSTSSHTATAYRKKGWSHGAKDAVIGGVGGAVIGAVIDKKNRGVGGALGGVLGAAAGYGLGHAKDKKMSY